MILIYIAASGRLFSNMASDWPTPAWVAIKLEDMLANPFSFDHDFNRKSCTQRHP